MTTVKDVAARAGVSVATVSRVLSGGYPVSEETRRRVMEAVAALHYQPNGIASSLRRARTGTIGVLVPDIANPYFMRLVRSVERTLGDQGYELVVASSGEVPKREESLLQMFFRKRVEAVVVAPTGPRLGEAGRMFRRGRIPMVVVDRRIEDAGWDMVAEEGQQSSQEAVRYLVSLGHRRIGLINGRIGISTAADREAGYRKALAEAGINWEDRWVWRGEFDEETGYLAGKAWLSLGAEAPTAVFCTNNLITIGLMRAVYEAGRSVPEDLSVVSFGDPFPAEFIRPRMTAVLQNPEAVGAQAAQILLRRLRQAEVVPATGGGSQEGWRVTQVVLPTMVRLGESACAPARP